MLFRSSLHEFWGRAWHQGLRHVFLVLGGFPAGRAAGGSAVAAAFGTFLASGLVHELAITVVPDADLDWRVVAFFALQGVGIVLERVYCRVTGRRVGGPLGFVWAAVFVLGFGQMCSAFSAVFASSVSLTTLSS